MNDSGTNGWRRTHKDTPPEKTWIYLSDGEEVQPMWSGYRPEELADRWPLWQMAKFPPLPKPALPDGASWAGDEVIYSETVYRLDPGGLHVKTKTHGFCVCAEILDALLKNRQRTLDGK